MFDQAKKNGPLIVFLVLLLCVSCLFYLDFHIKDKILTFAMLDVGQGDALFIESPSGTQILVDAGPPGKLLSALSKVMSPFDRHIDAIVITNPDADHIAGFLDVLKVYQVDMVLEPGTINDSKLYQNLEEQIKYKKIPAVLARKGMQLDLGGGVFIDILFPDRDVRVWSTNDGSIIARLSYGDTSIMLTGDSTIKTEQIVLSENSPESLKSTILKVGHHGSRTSTGNAFTKTVAPTYALISNGKDNNYGHPHRETLKTLELFGVKVMRTDLLGTIIMKSDGLKETFSFLK
ncbi:MAG: MBL fold metallo-hydrolase [Candidatus Pacebacteria bacterium]|nr:MBL fold metallo-hydrolase [Candidatus Paceibacterota bacterium]